MTGDWCSSCLYYSDLYRTRPPSHPIPRNLWTLKPRPLPLAKKYLDFKEEWEFAEGVITAIVTHDTEAEPTEVYFPRDCLPPDAPPLTFLTQPKPKFKHD